MTVLEHLEHLVGELAQVGDDLETLARAGGELAPEYGRAMCAYRIAALATAKAYEASVSNPDTHDVGSARARK